VAIELFERYLDALRQQARIPGLSAVMVQSGQIVWERGFGHREIEGSLPATPDTPYPIGDLSQTFAAALIERGAEHGALQLTDPIRTWSSAIPEPNVTLQHLLAHASDASARSGFRYDPSRFAALTAPISACTDKNYHRAVASEILDRFAMTDSVPGQELAIAATAERLAFTPAEVTRYTDILTRMARPYRIDKNGRASKVDTPLPELTAATGLISTARDLARFDIALAGTALVGPDLRNLAWHNTLSANGTLLPTGLGWFVQTYDGERLVWHFSEMPDAYSALMLKVPDRDLTLILLANSDGLSAGFSLSDGDVTTSLFARTFLRLFL
jgi:CubicO group peptidase (beta-lactamase class C family)